MKKYNHIWMIEVMGPKGKWHVTGGTWFHTCKEGKSHIKEHGWDKREEKYRVSKYMGRITSGIIQEI